MTAAYRITVIRRGRHHDDADGEARFQRYVGDLCGLGDETVAFLPPSVQVGWLAAGNLAFCLTCSPQSPRPICTVVYRESFHATQACVVCGRQLDTIA